MALAGLLALLDDIALLLDDVAVLTKVASAKTAGVVGDDLALNAHQLTGIATRREIPVILQVAKGSLVNKAILVPGALGISAVLPQAIGPLLMIGGLYLCTEGAEKILHRVKKSEAHPALAPPVDEKQKIRGAVRTDFILSAEIVVITLGTVAGADFITRLAVLGIIAIAMTVGVYGLVAAIIKMDDWGQALSASRKAVWRGLGWCVLAAAPVLMKTLSVVGTAAMFLIGGGILLHGLPGAEAALGEVLHHLPQVLSGPAHFLASGAFGVLAGVLAAGGIGMAKALRRWFKQSLRTGSPSLQSSQRRKGR